MLIGGGAAGDERVEESARLGRFGMGGAEEFFAQGEGLFPECLCRGNVTSCQFHLSDAGEEPGDVLMVVAVAVVASQDAQGRLEALFGGVELGLALKELAEIVVDLGHLRMDGAE